MGTDLPHSAGLYARLLGPAWSHLDEAIRAAHLPGNDTMLRASGRFRIRYGNGRLTRWLTRLLRLPPKAEAVRTLLVVTAYGGIEQWDRTFGDRKLVSVQQERAGGLLGERFGCLELRFRLDVEAGALVYRQIGAFVRLGPVSVPLRRQCSPQVAAREEWAGVAHRTRVTVQVAVPLVGVLIQYTGETERQESA